MKLKFIEEKAMKVVMLVTTLLVFLFVGSILYTIVKNGWGAMNWEMISSLPGGGFYIGKEGGSSVRCILWELLRYWGWR